MQQGSRLLADYEVTWDKDSFFKNFRSQPAERSRWVPARLGNYSSEDSRRTSQNSWFNPDDARRKRFKVCKCIFNRIPYVEKYLTIFV